MRLIYRDVGVYEYVYRSCEEKLSINLIELISYLLSNPVLSMRYHCIVENALILHQYTCYCFQSVN